MSGIWDRGLAQNYDLRLSQVASSGRRADVKIARADYFPQVQAVFSTEYDKSFSSIPQGVAFVGTTTLTGITRFQDVAAFYATYTAFDWGVRSNTLKSAKRMVDAAQINERAITRDLKLTLIEAYGQGLIAYKSLKAKEGELPVYQELFEIKQRLYDAGNLSRMELGEQALQLAQVQDDIKQWRETLTERLKELGSYTHTNYSVDNVQFVDFDEAAPPPRLMFKPEFMPDLRMYQLQIDAKKAELRALGAQRFPKLMAYSSYNLYGSNVNNPAAAIQDVRRRVYTVGLTLSMPLFDGFKNQGQRDKKRTEIQQLQIESEKKLWDLQAQFDKAAASADAYRAQLETKAEIINRGEQKIGMFQRLSDKKVMDRTALLTQQAQLTEQKLAADKVRVQTAAAAKKLEILTGG